MGNANVAAVTPDFEQRNGGIATRLKSSTSETLTVKTTKHVTISSSSLASMPNGTVSQKQLSRCGRQLIFLSGDFLQGIEKGCPVIYIIYPFGHIGYRPIVEKVNRLLALLLTIPDVPQQASPSAQTQPQ